MNDTSNTGVGNVDSNSQVPAGTVAQPAAPVAAPVAPPVVTQPQAPVAAPAPVSSVAPETQTVQPAAQPTVPVQQPATPQKAVTEISDEDMAVEVLEEKTVDKDEKGNTKDEDYVLEAKGNRNLPVVVLAIFIVILIFVVIYYFIVMKPARVFDKAINDAIDSVEDIVKNAKDSKTDTAGLNIKVNMKTVDDYVKYLNGLDIDGDIDVDIEKLSLGLRLNAVNVNTEDEYGADVYITSDGLFVANDRLKLLFDDNSVYQYDMDWGSDELLKLNYDRIDDAVKAFDETKERILDIIDDNDLKRIITTKKVGNQTTLALKVTCDLDNEEVAEIYYKVFKEYINGSDKSNKILDEIASAFGTDRETVKEQIQKLIDREVVTQRVFVNLYMNLANTQLISLDVTVEEKETNYFVELDNLNGLYICDIRYGPDLENPELYINFQYDENVGHLFGKGIIDDELTYMKLDFEYDRKIGENNKKIGNKLKLYFYRDEKMESAIALLDCTLDIVTNDEISILGKENAIAEKDVTKSVTDGVKDSLDELTHYYWFAFRQLRYNRLTDEEYIKYANNYLGQDGASHLEIISSVTDTTKYPTIYAEKKPGEMSQKLKDILSGKTKPKKEKKKTEEKVADTNETTVSDANETTATDTNETTNSTKTE